MNFILIGGFFLLNFKARLWIHIYFLRTCIFFNADPDPALKNVLQINL